ncbi:HD domain-containing protein [Azoarcus sp. L1K30]|uniref:HD-GYP domain-containing protein n=1 Tax=Azoarcus sp. L1K30 TaxID=2820277 RepID=UPI001B8160F8|nr:HD domain-containing phosphohydrolase [Azoarcus sp. L1K30]MBR0568919.1 HD domain-containing protein [Azoarcus sp. L1K30]
MGLFDFMRARTSPPANASAPMLASLLVMAWIVEARDPYTGGHLWRVSRYSALLAEAAGITGGALARIEIGGFLHDLGKIGIPDAILRKADRLSDEEYAVIRTHPDVGARMLAGHPLAALVLPAVLHHHETPDGRGYPHGLAGEEIPLDGRLVGICDAFDAMTSSRPYRAGMPIQTALDIIRGRLGTQFDAELGTRFIALGEAGALDHIAGHSDNGIPLQHCVMCGPTLVVRREARIGEDLYCRSCGGEYHLQAGDDGRPLAVPTGRRGGPAELEPEADNDLIARVIQGAATRAPIEAMMMDSD